MNRGIKQMVGWGLLTWFTCPGVSAQALDSISSINHALPLDTAQVVADAVLPPDTIQAATDTVPKPASVVDAPVHYAAQDSMVMMMKGQNMIYLYGQGSVEYTSMELTGEYIEIDSNNNTLFATFAVDSIGEEFGYPVFKDGEMQYEMKKARYNFKTKKMFITDVITQQGEGYMTANQTKKMPNDDLYVRNARYTTCDDHEHPHFYLHLTKAKLRPGKDVVAGPVYLVVEDVPLPFALPFAFFPFTENYSSGIIVPRYGDELKRGFSLENGGYYFAISDYMDLALTGEIFTRGSWGLNAATTYKKRYKFGGRFETNYRVTVLGEKDEDPDYSKTKDIKVSWTHSQDAKANPFFTFSANVNFSTSSYTKNDLSSQYSGQASQNTASSNISFTYRPPGSVFSFSGNASINQVKRDTTLSVTLPTLNITMREIYPLQRKERVGTPRWYENIRMSYTGVLSNSIQNVKEYDFFNKKLIGDWKNGMQHRIPISASLNLKHITITPSVNYEEKWYTTRIDQRYDYELRRGVPADTVTGFYRVYNYNANVSAQTKLYFMYQPLNFFGEWTKKTIIRHVMTPNISFSGAPDFSDKKFGFYKDLIYENDGRVDTLSYWPYHTTWGMPSQQSSGTMNFSLDNNVEMKIPIAGSDSTRKISLIDQLRLSTSCNFLKDTLQWSDINVSLRLKLFKNYTLNLGGAFDIYEYNENGRQINRLRWKTGSIGRFRGTSQTLSFSLNNEKLRNWFTRKEKEDNNEEKGNRSDEGMDLPDLDNVDALGAGDDMNAPARTSSLRKSKAKEGDYDTDGYSLTNIPWNVNVNYSFGFSYDNQNFNKEKRQYPYKITQNLGISGSITPTKNWNFTFNTGYDFDRKQFTPTQLQIRREMHCWTMSASLTPIGPYKSYHFTIAVKSSLLQDIKYNQSSNFHDSMNWGY